MRYSTAMHLQKDEIFRQLDKKAQARIDEIIADSNQATILQKSMSSWLGANQLKPDVITKAPSKRPRIISESRQKR